MIVHHYLECAKSVRGKHIHVYIIISNLHNYGVGCPAMLRCDYGMENVSLATAQIGFRLHHNDSLAGERSFMYGPSKSNIVSGCDNY